MSSNQQKRIEKYLKEKFKKFSIFLNQKETYNISEIKSIINYRLLLNINEIEKYIDIIKHYFLSVDNDDYLIKDFDISRIKRYSTDELISFLSNYHNSFIRNDNWLGIIENVFINKEKYNDELILYVLAKIISNKYYEYYKKKQFSAVKKNTPLRNILESPSMITFLQKKENNDSPKTQKTPETPSRTSPKQKTPETPSRTSPKQKTPETPSRTSPKYSENEQPQKQHESFLEMLSSKNPRISPKSAIAFLENEQPQKQHESFLEDNISKKPRTSPTVSENKQKASRNSVIALLQKQGTSDETQKIPSTSALTFLKKQNQQRTSPKSAIAFLEKENEQPQKQHESFLEMLSSKKPRTSPTVSENKQKASRNSVIALLQKQGTSDETQKIPSTSALTFLKKQNQQRTSVKTQKKINQAARAKEALKEARLNADSAKKALKEARTYAARAKAGYEAVHEAASEVKRANKALQVAIRNKARADAAARAGV